MALDTRALFDTAKDVQDYFCPTFTLEKLLKVLKTPLGLMASALLDQVSYFQFNHPLKRA